MTRSFSRSLAVGIGLAVLSACGPDMPTVAAVPHDVGPIASNPTVAVDDNLFEPAELVVGVGTTVTWNWQGRAAHDVVGDGFDSGVLTEGSFAHTFTAPGSYSYTCRLHRRMDGVVHVLDEVER